MRIFHVLVMTVAWLAALMAAPAWAQGGAFVGETHIAARLKAESLTPAPGKPVTLAFVMTPEAGWHGYWENPGDAGLGMRVEWTLPQGVKAGPLRHPVPETLLISGLMNHVYEGPYAILVTVDVPAAAKPGDRLPVRAKGDWLACTEQICVPQSGTMAVDLVVGDGAVSAASRKAFDGYRARLPRPLGSQAHYAVEQGRLRLGVPFPAGAPVSDVWFFAEKDGAVKYAAPQKVARSGDWLIDETQAGESPSGTIAGVLRTADHEGFAIRAVPGAVPQADGAGGMVATVLLALSGAVLGGLILNIMPCVFPILSLKALSLAKAGAEDAKAVRREAWAYAAGVVVTCLALGGVLLALRAGGAAVGWAFQLQDPRVILLLLLLVTGIALNLAGLFELRGVSVSGRLANGGAFWTGALVAFVATPCTGPFMGAALGAALVLPPVAALAIFAGLGIGLALPFVLIALVPAIRRRMPRPGAWMATFQRILSVPMFLTALALAWLLGQQTGTSGMTLGVGAALAVGVVLWWLGVRQSKGTYNATLTLLALGLVFVGSVMALPTEKPAAQAASEASGRVAFSEARLAELRAQGKPVFLYFTADWCLTCKANEAAAIDRAEVAQAFAKAGVTVMVGDWTNADPAIGRFLESQGRSGVPLYLWYGDGKEARVLPQVLTPGILTGLVGG